MSPTADQELRLLAEGYRRVAGLDEVGVGCLAGPVVAAAVILNSADLFDLAVLCDVRDSKIVPAEERERLRDLIEERAVAIGVGVMPTELIDAIGIAPSTRLAMMAAIAELRPSPDHLLIDYVRLRGLGTAQTSIIDGDALCISIAAASIIAKTERDRLMRAAECEYPGYAFGQHKGYGTPAHLAALAELGPSPLHRRTYAPLRYLVPA